MPEIFEDWFAARNNDTLAKYSNKNWFTVHGAIVVSVHSELQVSLCQRETCGCLILSQRNMGLKDLSISVKELFYYEGTVSNPIFLQKMNVEFSHL